MKKGLTKSLPNATEQFESEIMQSMPWKKKQSPGRATPLFNTAKCALEKLGPDAVTALRFLKTHRRLTWGFNPPSLLPPGLTDSRANAVYRLRSWRALLHPQTGRVAAKEPSK